MKWKSGLTKALSTIVFIWSLTACALFSDDEQLNPQEEVAAGEETQEGATEEMAAEPPIGDGEGLTDGSADITDNGLTDGSFDGGQLPEDGGLNQAETDTAGGFVDTAGAFSNTEAAPQTNAGMDSFSGAAGDAQVMYVTADGTTMVDRPNGSPVAPSLRQGDPVLTKPEGNWQHVVNRGYLKQENLSTSPIGRQKAPSRWR
jgi:hypothetical protein